MPQPILKTLKNSAVAQEPFSESSNKVKVKKNRFPMKNRYPQINCGKWNKVEKKCYQDFLMEHKEQFRFKDTRRQSKIFVKMAGMMKSRCPEQCRSHHQKVEKQINSQNIDEILDYLHGLGKERQEKEHIKVQDMSNKKTEIEDEGNLNQVKVEDEEQKFETFLVITFPDYCVL